MVTLRPFRADDLEALYAICLATGNAGLDASSLYRNARLIGSIYSAPYALLAPELVIVAQDAAYVSGFVVGALDTLAWQERLERCWWPKLRREYPVPDAFEKERWTFDEQRAAMIHAPEGAPASVLKKYPAHLHLNLLPNLQGLGVGASLLQAWFDLTARHSATAAHVGVNPANTRALRFWAKMGFQDIMSEDLKSGRTIWMGRP